MFNRYAFLDFDPQKCKLQTPCTKSKSHFLGGNKAILKSISS